MRFVKKISGGKNILYMILALALILSVMNLADRTFWGDETHLLHFSRSIISPGNEGLPVLTADIKGCDVTYEIDGATNVSISAQEFFVADENYVTEISGKEVYSMHPWLLMYSQAIPMYLFGPYNEFFIRLLFVLIGLLAIPLTYSLAMHITRRKDVANLSAFFLACSVVYLLAIRNANYYALLVASVPAVMLYYLKMTSPSSTDAKGRSSRDISIIHNAEKKKDLLEFGKYGKKYWWKFAIAAAVLFHSNWLVFVATMFGIALHFLIFHVKLTPWKNFSDNIKRSFHNARYMIYSLILIALLTAPWFILTQQYAKGGIHTGIKDYVLLLFVGSYQFFIWFTPLIFLVLLAVLYFKYKDTRESLVNSRTMLIAIMILSYLGLMALNRYSGIPVRYFYGLLPAAMMINAMVICLMWDKWKKIRILTVIILSMFLLTNFIHIAPMVPLVGMMKSTLESNKVLNTTDSSQMEYLKRTTTPRAPFFEYIGEITRHVETPTRAVIRYIQDKQGKVDEYTYTSGYHTASTTYSQEKMAKVRIFVGKADPNAIGYYINSQIYSFKTNFKLKEYDFIILAAADARNSEVDRNIYEAKYFPLESRQWGDTADPTHHVFKTMYGEGFYVYSRKAS